MLLDPAKGILVISLNLTVRGKSNRAADKNFAWSDEEINLLLHVVIDYKAGKTRKGDDWGTVRSKYEEVTKRYMRVCANRIIVTSQMNHHMI